LVLSEVRITFLYVVLQISAMQIDDSVSNYGMDSVPGNSNIPRVFPETGTAASMNEEPSVPICAVCQHPHIQGVKCHICGHKGRSNIYQKMQARSKLARAFKITWLDASSASEPDFEYRMNIAAVLRRETMDNPNDFEVDFEMQCRHCIGVEGSAPVSIGRWRYLQDNEGRRGALIDRLGVIKRRRGQGIARHILGSMVNDIKSHQSTQGAPVMIMIPQPCTWAMELLSKVGWSCVLSNEPLPGIPANVGPLYICYEKDSPVEHPWGVNTLSRWI